MIDLQSYHTHQLIALETEDAALNKSIARVIDHVGELDAGVVYNMVGIDSKRLTRWARKTTVDIEGDLAELADFAADAVPAGRVDTLVRLDGEIRTISVVVRMDVWPRKRAVQVAMDDRPLLTRQAEREMGGETGVSDWRGACTVAVSESTSVLDALRSVLGCLALIAKMAIALHKVTDAVADGRTWTRYPRITQKKRVLKPHYRRAHWRRFKESWVFVRATIVHADRLDKKIAADVAATGVLYVPMLESKRRDLIEDRMFPVRFFGMVANEVAELAKDLGLVYDRPIFSYMRALGLVLAELAYRERFETPGNGVISLERARRVLAHRLIDRRVGVETMA